MTNVTRPVVSPLRGPSRSLRWCQERGGEPTEDNPCLKPSLAPSFSSSSHLTESSLGSKSVCLFLQGGSLVSGAGMSKRTSRQRRPNRLRWVTTLSQRTRTVDLSSGFAQIIIWPKNWSRVYLPKPLNTLNMLLGDWCLHEDCESETCCCLAPLSHLNCTSTLVREGVNKSPPSLLLLWYSDKKEF